MRQPGAQHDPAAVGPGQFGQERGLFRPVIFFFFVEMGNDWATEAAPTARGCLCSLCGGVLGAAATSAVTQPVKGVCKSGSQPRQLRQFSARRTLVFVDYNYKKRPFC